MLDIDVSQVSQCEGFFSARDDESNRFAGANADSRGGDGANNDAFGHSATGLIFHLRVETQGAQSLGRHRFSLTGEFWHLRGRIGGGSGGVESEDPEHDSHNQQHSEQGSQGDSQGGDAFLLDSPSFQQLKACNGFAIGRLHAGCRNTSRHGRFHANTGTCYRKAGWTTLGSILQRGTESLSRGEALVQFFLQGAFHDGNEFGGNPRSHLDQWCRDRGDVFVGDAHRRITSERRFAAEQLIHHDTEGIKVGAGVRFIAPGLFGGDI